MQDNHVKFVQCSSVHFVMHNLSEAWDAVLCLAGAAAPESREGSMDRGAIQQHQS
jgi:hypothetical protein